jgi:hypothetical protein
MAAYIDRFSLVRVGSLVRRVLFIVCAAVAVLANWGCQATPTPFILKGEVEPPFGCVEARNRGVEC